MPKAPRASSGCRRIGWWSWARKSSFEVGETEGTFHAETRRRGGWVGAVKRDEKSLRQERPSRARRGFLSVLRCAPAVRNDSVVGLPIAPQYVATAPATTMV